MWQRFTEEAWPPVIKGVSAGLESTTSYTPGSLDVRYQLTSKVFSPDSPLTKLVRRIYGKPSAKNESSALNKYSSRAQQGSAVEQEPSLSHIIDRAADEAKALNNKFIGPKHLLMAIIRFSNSGGSVNICVNVFLV
jgi:ATP-dependent Clp protease ATP-binding subunit ClpA